MWDSNSRWMGILQGCAGYVRLTSIGLKQPWWARGASEQRRLHQKPSRPCHMEAQDEPNSICIGRRWFWNQILHKGRFGPPGWHPQKILQRQDWSRWERVGENWVRLGLHKQEGPPLDETLPWQVTPTIRQCCSHEMPTLAISTRGAKIWSQETICKFDESEPVGN